MWKVPLSDSPISLGRWYCSCIHSFRCSTASLTRLSFRPNSPLTFSRTSSVGGSITVCDILIWRQNETCGAQCCIWCSFTFLYTKVLYQYPQNSITLPSPTANTTPSHKHPLSHLTLQYLYAGYYTGILSRQKYKVLLTVTIMIQHDKKYTCNNIETRSYKHCSSEDAISTTYSECVLVVLCIQHGMLHNIFSHCVLKGTIFGKKFWTKTLFLFSLQLSLATCIIVRRTVRDLITMHTCLHLNHLLLMLGFYETWIFLTDLRIPLNIAVHILRLKCTSRCNVWNIAHRIT